MQNRELNINQIYDNLGNAVLDTAVGVTSILMIPTAGLLAHNNLLPLDHLLITSGVSYSNALIALSSGVIRSIYAGPKVKAFESLIKSAKLYATADIPESGDRPSERLGRAVISFYSNSTSEDSI